MRQIIFIILSLCFLFFGCTNDSVEIEKDINSDILVSTYIENENVYIKAETVKEYECITYSIDYLIESDSELITIKFIGVTKPPDGCFFSFGPAESRIDLGNLEAGDYAIKFKLNGITTNANLIVNTISNLSISKEQNVKIK